ncbi:MAG: hydantoinase/oxoprolinase family protein [Methanosarcinaceae archaeon]|nr:hydantoinase/oxoprolinase family protein [Methanosarcinaceae archaeon]
MLIGIDVGGTTTDAVLIHDGKVKSSAKVPTEPQNLLKSLLSALDAVSRDVSPEKLKRVVFSTTVITNLIAEGKTDPVALLLIPGPGMNPAGYDFPNRFVLKGAVDYRGREIRDLDEKEILETAARIREEGISRVAVVSKFCQRNPVQELRVRELVEEALPGSKVELGHRVSGKLNFPRRIATTMLSAATKEQYLAFLNEILKALSERNIKAPVYILKADGGTLPLEKSSSLPVETIFSGPAASTMGALALTSEGESSIVADIGGTTTDLALILSGKPLIASKGAKLPPYLTHVRAFAVRSLPVGGDSAVRVVENESRLRIDAGVGGETGIEAEIETGTETGAEEGQKKISVGPDRAGPAYCLGGPETTPTDALRVLGLSEIGDLALAEEAVARVGSGLGKTGKETAELILDMASGLVASAVRDMFLEWEQEPAYRIWEVLQEKKAMPKKVIGVGGGARGLIERVAEKLGAEALIPEHAEVGNAMGAALARPTLTLNLHVDTERKEYSVAEEGGIVRLHTTDIKNINNMRSGEAEALAAKLLRARAESFGISEYAGEAELTGSEVFNMVRNWSTVGRLFDVSMQIPAGLIPEWKRGGKA